MLTESLDKPQKQVVVRAFGARLLDPETSTPLLLNVLARQNQLWNKLVEIDHAARAEYNQALASSSSELAKLIEIEAGELATKQALLEQRAKARAAKRSKSIDANAGIQSALSACNQRLKELWPKIKLAKMAAKETAKPLVDAAEQTRRERVKQASSEFNLWWGHSETVLNRYDRARVKAMRAGIMLRFHRFDGQGSMGVRFTIDGGSLTKISAGKTDQLSITEATPDQLNGRKARTADGTQRVVVAMRMGKKDQDGNIPKVSLLVSMHAGRDFPQNIPLKTVTLSREVHVNRVEYGIVFTFSREAEKLPEIDLPTKVCGIDFGFRLVRDPKTLSRGLRVATVVWGGDDLPWHCVLDEEWIKRMELADKLRSELDEFANNFQAKILPKISIDEINAAAIAEDSRFAVLAGKVRRSKGAYTGLLLALCHAHRDAGAPLGIEMETTMQVWSKRAVDLAFLAHNTKRRAVAHRSHIFRNFAAEIVKEAGMLGVVDTNFREIAKLMDSQGKDNDLPDAARRYRTLAAPSELRRAIINAALRERRVVVDVPSQNQTRTCAACGHVHQAASDDRHIDLTFICDVCHKVWDQDVNLATNCRKYAIESEHS